MSWVVVWGGTEREVMDFLAKTHTPRRSVFICGDASVRSILGLVPTAVIQVGTAGRRPLAAKTEAVLMRAIEKAPGGGPVPWIDLRDAA